MLFVFAKRYHRPNEDFDAPQTKILEGEQKMKSEFSKHFAMFCAPNRVLTHLKSASFEIRISSFVPPSKIVVWDG
jgi:hypothetical protein